MRKVTLLHRVRRKIRSRNSSYHPSSSWYRWWVLGNVMIGTFMSVLDATIVNVGLPKIMTSFGVGLDRIEWVLTAYMLALAVMLPTTAWLADHFGYKRLYFIGLLFFTLGSFLCGISPNENILILSRIIQGLGAGTIMPIGMAIITREFPPNQRGIALGFWSIAAAASVSFGPLIGGYLVDTFSWPLIFDVNVPIGIAGLLITVLIQREYISKDKRKFDLVGFISIGTFLPLTLYALAEGNAVTNSAGWKAPYILVCFAIAFLALVVFISNELVVKHPLIELRLLSNRNFGICNIIIFLFGMGMFGSTFLMPMYLQNSLGYTAIQAGAVFLPVGIIQGLMSPMAGIAADRLNPKIPVILGVIIMSASFYMNSSLSYLTEHHYIMITLYMRGLGMGLLFTPLSAVSLLEIPREKMAQASGLTNTIRQLAGSFGVAILATLLSTRVKFHNQLYSEALNSSSPTFKMVTGNLVQSIQHATGASMADAMKLSQSAIAGHLAKQSYIQGINDDFLIASLLTLVGVIPVFWLHTKKVKHADKKTSHEIQMD
jgi:MFS transporter, DHA2 family, multidrug resistance protein